MLALGSSVVCALELALVFYVVFDNMGLASKVGSVGLARFADCTWHHYRMLVQLTCQFDCVIDSFTFTNRAHTTGTLLKAQLKLSSTEVNREALLHLCYGCRCGSQSKL